MSEQQHLKRQSWLTEPLRAEESRILRRSFMITLVSCIFFGSIPILLGKVINQPIVSWLGYIGLFFGCIWMVVVFIPQFLRVMKQVRMRTRMQG